MSMTCCFTLLDVVHIKDSSKSLNSSPSLLCLVSTLGTISTSLLLLNGSLRYSLFRDCPPFCYNNFIATTSFLSVGSAALRYASQRCSIPSHFSAAFFIFQSAIIVVQAGNASPSSKPTIARVTRVLANVCSAYCLGRGNRQFNS